MNGISWTYEKLVPFREMLLRNGFVDNNDSRLNIIHLERNFSNGVLIVFAREWCGVYLHLQHGDDDDSVVMLANSQNVEAFEAVVILTVKFLKDLQAIAPVFK